MSYYYNNNNDNRRSRDRYFETNYDRNTPVAQYLRDRQKVNIALFADQTIYPDPSAASCKFCHESLILVDNGANLLCQGCGIRRKPTVAPASTPTPTLSNDSSISKDKDKPTLPKVKQKDSLENKSFI